MMENKEYTRLLQQIKTEDRYSYFSDLLTCQNQIAYDRLNIGIDDRFLNKMGRLAKGHQLIRRAISNTQYDYVILLCDEEDISATDRKRIIMAKNSFKKLFLIMLCPNKIMREDHDASGIPDIIENKKELSGFPVGLTIEKRFNENIPIYVELIKEYAHIDKFRTLLKSEIACFEEIINEYGRITFIDEWDRINAGWCVYNLKKIMDSAFELNEKCSHVLKSLEAQYSEYASDCKNELAEEKFQKEAVGDFAADLLFKYDGIQRLLKDQLSKLKKSKCITDKTFSTMVDKCINRMEEKPKVSFVGNFSSGKTSFINWLLAMEGNKQLRTSGGHNTAILTLIKKSEVKEKEQVLLEYKKSTDLFTWKLFSLEYETELADVYKGENNAVVFQVDETERVIIYKFKDKKKQILLNNKYDKILVKKNDRLQKGMPLTEGAKNIFDMSRNNANVSLRKEEEYTEIKKAIEQNKLLEVVISVSYIKKKNIKNRTSADEKMIELKNKEDILRFISRLIKLEQKFDTCNIRFEDVENIGFWNAEKISYLPDEIDYIYNVTIDGKCNFEDKEEFLTDECWKKYCGTGKNDERVFTETPEGYLFTKQITYYLNNGFLNYSDIIDTPGLGSTSDEHDEITERYIREKISNLLVMLKIDKNGKSMERRKFIHEIAEIYENSGRDKNDVFFVCNLWSKDYEQKILNELKNICDQYFEVIKKCGFNQKNFYVIDIQKMQAGHHANIMFDKYQSDECFEDKFVNHIADKGIRQQIETVKKDISQLFEERELHYWELISFEKLDSVKRQEKKERLKEVKSKVQMTKFDDSFDDIFTKDNEALNELEELAKDISLISRRKEWLDFTKKCLNKMSYIEDYDEIGAIEFICKDAYETNQVKDRIVDKYILRLNQLKKYLVDVLEYDDKNSIYRIIQGEMDSIQRIGMSGFPFNDLRNRIAAQSQHFESKIHFFHNADISRRDAKDISDFIYAQIEESKVENEINYSKMTKNFNDIVSAILSEIERLIEGLTLESSDEKIEGYQRFIDELAKTRNRWNSKIKINTNI